MWEMMYDVASLNQWYRHGQDTAKRQNSYKTVIGKRSFGISKYGWKFFSTTGFSQMGLLGV
jgi:hypothetical protein